MFSFQPISILLISVTFYLVSIVLSCDLAFKILL